MCVQITYECFYASDCCGRAGKLTCTLSAYASSDFTDPDFKAAGVQLLEGASQVKVDCEPTEYWQEVQHELSEPDREFLRNEADHDPRNYCLSALMQRVCFQDGQLQSCVLELPGLDSLDFQADLYRAGRARFYVRLDDGRDSLSWFWSQDNGRSWTSLETFLHPVVQAWQGLWKHCHHL